MDLQPENAPSVEVIRISYDQTSREYTYDESNWRDVQRETGFNSYAEYVNACPGDYWSLCGILNESDNSHRSIASCSIFDISGTGEMSAVLDVLDHSSCVHSFQILNILRNPSSQSILRVLLIEDQTDKGHEFPGDPGMIHSLIDVIRLSLRISPTFFDQHLRSRGWKNPPSVRTRLGNIGDVTFTVASEYLPGKNNCPPVLIMIGHPLGRWLAPITHEPAPFTRSDLDTLQTQTENGWSDSFKFLAQDFLRRHQNEKMDNDEALALTLIPLLETRLGRLVEIYYDAKHEYQGLKLSSLINNFHRERLEKHRIYLGRQIIEFEHSMNSYERYLPVQTTTKPTNNEAVETYKRNAMLYLHDARSSEAEIRDLLQVQVGSLALQESQKSIQLSTLQINEYKRGEFHL